MLICRYLELRAIWLEIIMVMMYIYKSIQAFDSRKPQRVFFCFCSLDVNVMTLSGAENQMRCFIHSISVMSNASNVDWLIDATNQFSSFTGIIRQTKQGKEYNVDWLVANLKERFLSVKAVDADHLSERRPTTAIRRRFGRSFGNNAVWSSYVWRFKIQSSQIGMVKCFVAVDNVYW